MEKAMASFILYDWIEDREDFFVMWKRFRRLLTHMGFVLSWDITKHRQSYETKSFIFNDKQYQFYLWNEQGLMDIDTMRFCVDGDCFHVTDQEQSCDRVLSLMCRTFEREEILPFSSEQDFVAEFFEFLNDYIPE